MNNCIDSKQKLHIASNEKTLIEIYSIVLKGVTSTLKSLFIDYYVSDNIEALMKYINEKKVIKAHEYKLLLEEAKDFYPVIICAVILQPLRKHTKAFKIKDLDNRSKKLLFKELYSELFEFFLDWLCIVEIDPLLFKRLAVCYKKDFNMNLYISRQLNKAITPIEDRIIRLQMIDIISIYLIEQIGVQLGFVGLDYIDYYDGEEIEYSNNNENIESLISEKCTDTILNKL